MTRFRVGLAVAAAAVAILAIAVPLWALPNIAGPAFVRVRAVVSPTIAANGTEVAVGANPTVRASTLGIAVDSNGVVWAALAVASGAASPKPAARR